MSSENEGAPEVVGQQQPNQPQVPAEFLERVNQFLRLANRAERYRDTQYANLVFMNAFARYAGHNYVAQVKVDTPQERKAYIEFIANAVAESVAQNIGLISDFAKRRAAEAQAQAQAKGASGTTDTPAA